MTSLVIKRLAHIADREAMWAEDLAKHPELLKGTGIDLEDITALTARQANRHNREQLEALFRRYKANEYAPQPTFTKSEGGETTRSGRTKLWGHSVTAILRWMGQHGWTYERACKALRSLEVDVAPGTVRAQLAAGKKGERGEPAELRKGEILKLNVASD